MANKPVMGYSAAEVQRRHGQENCVVLRVDIPKNLKDELVMRADYDNTTIKNIVINALKSYLSTMKEESLPTKPDPLLIKEICRI